MKNCIDCGVETKGSARCPCCWNGRFGDECDDDCIICHPPEDIDKVAILGED